MPDTSSLRLPISIKAALLEGGRVCLLLNERDQWELPGGRLEAGESPADCLVREVREELGLIVRAGSVLDTWVFSAVPGKETLVIVYTAAMVEAGEATLSAEHRALRWCTAADLDGLRMPPGYAAVLASALTAGGESRPQNSGSKKPGS